MEGDYNQQLVDLSEQVADLAVKINTAFKAQFDQMEQMVKLFEAHNNNLRDILNQIKQ